MKQRIITALLVILVAVPPVIIGGWPLEILALFILYAAAFEWFSVHNQNKTLLKFFPIFLATLTVLSRYVPQNFEFAYYILCIVGLWSANIFFESFTIDNAWLSIAFFVIFSSIYTCIGWIQENHLYLITMIFATYGSDTGAWFFGRKYGRHKMNPRVSPKKSWEGFFGGILSGFIIGWIPTFFYLDSVSLSLIFLLCLLCPVVAEFGDFSFSAIKRYYGIKDFSNILPGHGGILDRTDSLLMNILLFGVLYSSFF